MNHSRFTLGGATPIVHFIIACVLHVWLGWPWWVSILLSYGGLTLLETVFWSKVRPPVPEEELTGIMRNAWLGCILAMVTTYILVVIISALLGHPSW